MTNIYHKRVGNYIFIQPIGKGAFAEVFKGVHQTTHEEVAIKMMSRAKARDEEILIEKEIRILKELSNSNIVRFLDYQKTQNHYYLIFEFCKHGDLDHFIRDFYNGKVPEIEAQKFVQQIIEGIKAMKAKNIVHRDLKLANILVSKDFILKIADFGLARFMEKDDLLLKSIVGTPLNMDPLILEKKGYSEKCDIWSLGVIFYQILVGRPPYNPGRGAGIMDLLALIQRQPLIFPQDIPLSDSVKGLIKSMLVYDVNKRISFEDLFNHEWITGKFAIDDQKQNLMMDLSATQLLQSVYDKKKAETKKDKKSKVPEKEKIPVVEEPVVKVEDENPAHEAKFESLSESERQRELYGAAFLAKAYEVFRHKIFKLKEFFMKIQNMNIPAEAFDDERISIIQPLLSMDILKMLREILTFKFGIVNEANEEIIFNNDFKAFWDKIMANKQAIENFYCTNDADLDISDLYNQVKADYIELFENMNGKLEGLKDTFERFRGHNLEKLIVDCLIQLSENSAYQEFLEENIETKIDKYNTCFQISEFLVFKNSFKFTFFKIVEKNEEQKGNNETQNLLKSVTEIFQKDVPFTGLLQMSENEEYKKKFNIIKNSISITEAESPSITDLEQPLRKLQTLLGKRITDLKEKEDVELSF
jgi:serine/threonine protein kinase